MAAAVVAAVLGVAGTVLGAVIALAGTRFYQRRDERAGHDRRAAETLAELVEEVDLLRQLLVGVIDALRRSGIVVPAQVLVPHRDRSERDGTA